MRIQILDNFKVEMFPLGSAEMISRTNEVMAKIAESIKSLPNKVAIVGHTDATPYSADSGYSNWELSTDRAHASRRALVAAGLPEDRISTVIGKAATDPLNKADPEDPSNRRISILLQREDTPAAPLNRKQSKKQRDPYASRYEDRNGAQSSRKPILAPVRGSQDSAVDGEDDIDPMEEPLSKEVAPQIEDVEKAEKVEKIEKLEPAEKLVESIKTKEPEAAIEIPPVEELEPEVEPEPDLDDLIIDNDLFLWL